MHPVDPWQVIFIVVMMLATGGACGFSLGVEYVRSRRRRDEAAQFDPGDRVTFGDRSYIVVRSAEAPSAAKESDRG